MARIVVGFDGSEGARRALEWAIGEAALRTAPLLAVTVVPIPLTVGLAAAPVAGIADETALRETEAVNRAAVEKAAVGYDVDVSVQAICGIPAEVLLNASEGADLLVVGARGHGGFARLLLGSVSSQLAHHANCPIVIVPERHGRRP